MQITDLTCGLASWISYKGWYRTELVMELAQCLMKVYVTLQRNNSSKGKTTIATKQILLGSAITEVKQSAFIVKSRVHRLHKCRIYNRCTICISNCMSYVHPFRLLHWRDAFRSIFIAERNKILRTITTSIMQFLLDPFALCRNLFPPPFSLTWLCTEFLHVLSATQAL